MPRSATLESANSAIVWDDKRKQAQKHFGVGGGAVGEAGQKRSQLLEKRPEPAEKLPPMGPGVGVPCTRGCHDDAGENAWGWGVCERESQ